MNGDDQTIAMVNFSADEDGSLASPSPVEYFSLAPTTDANLRELARKLIQAQGQEVVVVQENEIMGRGK